MRIQNVKCKSMFGVVTACISAKVRKSGLKPPCRQRKRSSISAAMGKALKEARQAS